MKRFKDEQIEAINRNKDLIIDSLIQNYSDIFTNYYIIYDLQNSNKFEKDLVISFNYITIYVKYDNVKKPFFFTQSEILENKEIMKIINNDIKKNKLIEINEANKESK